MRFPTFISWLLKYPLYEVVNGFLTTGLASLDWQVWIVIFERYGVQVLYNIPNEKQINLEVRLVVLMQRPSINNHLSTSVHQNVGGCYQLQPR